MLIFCKTKVFNCIGENIIRAFYRIIALGERACVYVKVS